MECENVIINKTIIKSFLKKKRKEVRMSAKEVVEALSSYGFNISPKTIYGYEDIKSGGMPNADMFLSLCKVYGCENPMIVFGNTGYTPEENRLIRDYRTISPYAQETIRIMLDRELRHNTHNPTASEKNEKG